MCEEVVEINSVEEFYEFVESASLDELYVLQEDLQEAIQNLSDSDE